MSDERLTDEQIEKALYVAARGATLDTDVAVAALLDLKAARQEIARWEALPPRMAEPDIRPVFPIDENEGD